MDLLMYLFFSVLFFCMIAGAVYFVVSMPVNCARTWLTMSEDTFQKLEKYNIKKFYKELYQQSGSFLYDKTLWVKMDAEGKGKKFEWEVRASGDFLQPKLECRKFVILVPRLFTPSLCYTHEL